MKRIWIEKSNYYVHFGNSETYFRCSFLCEIDGLYTERFCTAKKTDKFNEDYVFNDMVDLVYQVMLNEDIMGLTLTSIWNSVLHNRYTSIKDHEIKIAKPYSNNIKPLEHNYELVLERP